MKARTVTAIALLPTGKGQVKFTSLSTGKTIVRITIKIMKSVSFRTSIYSESDARKRDVRNGGVARTK